MPASVTVDSPAKHSEALFKHLATCGGWLASLCTLLSTLTGLSEIFILSLIFVISWMTLRTAPAFLASTLGSLFTLSLPMQYQIQLAQRKKAGKALDPSHVHHLRGYWRLMLAATVAEWTVLEIFDDGADKSFTVCAKTAALALLFMAKVRGTWVTSYFG